MRRITIKTSMSCLALIAVGLAALRHANDAWAAIIQTLVIRALASAILGVVQQRGKNRARWAGFAFFAGGYLLLALGPWFSDNIGADLATSQLFDYGCQAAQSPYVPGLAMNAPSSSFETPGDEYNRLANQHQYLTGILRNNPARSDVAEEIEQIRSRMNGTGFFHNGLTSSRLRASRLLSFRNC
jgi:hypothetical protein